MQTTIGHKLKVGTHSEQEKLKIRGKMWGRGRGRGKGRNIHIIIEWIWSNSNMLKSNSEMSVKFPINHMQGHESWRTNLCWKINEFTCTLKLAQKFNTSKIREKNQEMKSFPNRNKTTTLQLHIHMNLSKNSKRKHSNWRKTNFLTDVL